MDIIGIYTVQYSASGIGTVRNLLIDSFLEDDDFKRLNLFQKAISELAKYTVSIRPGRAFPPMPSG